MKRFEAQPAPVAGLQLFADDAAPVNAADHNSAANLSISGADADRSLRRARRSARFTRRANR